MGRDKAGLRPAGPDGPALLDRARACFEPNTCELLFAVGRRERQECAGFRQVLDAVPDAGPLAGLVAGLEVAHASHGDVRVCVSACDMPYIEWAVFEELLSVAEARDADVVLARTGSKDEPLCAVYHTRVLPVLRASLHAGERRLIAFHARPLEDPEGTQRALRIERVVVASARALANVNTPAEYARVVAEART